MAKSQSTKKRIRATIRPFNPSVMNPSKDVSRAPMPLPSGRTLGPMRPKRRPARPGEKGSEGDLFSGKVTKTPATQDPLPPVEEPLPPGAATQATPQPTAIRPASNKWSDIVKAYFPETGGNVYKEGGMVRGGGAAKRGCGRGKMR